VAHKQESPDRLEETSVCGEKLETPQKIMSKETVSCNVKGWTLQGTLHPFPTYILS